MSVYRFTCDNPGGCDGEYESLPGGDGLRGAVKELRHARWIIRDGKHYCPKHEPQNHLPLSATGETKED
jgi:hypothetical protein